MATSQQKSNLASVPDFWKLVAQSQLYSSEQCRKLHSQYSQQHDGNPPNHPQSLAQWLVSRNFLTRYQAKVLLAGRAGPFFYGDYKLTDRAGDAPFQNTFRAVHVPTRHPVMLGFLTGPDVQDPARWTPLRARCDALCRLRGEHLHRWYECVEAGGYKFIVSEDVTGQLLAGLLEAGRLAAGRACWIAYQLADAAATLHAQGIVYGQLRPTTAWVDKTHHARLLLDPLVPAAIRAVDPEDVCADYMAPELFAGHPPTPASDVYALGCTLYHMLAGRPPFPGGTTSEKAQRHAREPVAPLEGVKAPATLGPVLASLLAKDPAARIGQMSDVLKQLEPFVADERHAMPPTLPVPTAAAFEKSLAERLPAAPAANPLVAVAPTARQAAAPIGPTGFSPPAPGPAAAPQAAPITVTAQASTTPAHVTPASPVIAPSGSPPPSGPVPGPIPISVDLKPAPRRRTRTRGGLGPIVITSLAVTALVAGAWYMGSREPEAPAIPSDLAAHQDPEKTAASSAEPSGPSTPAERPQRVLPPDDGRSLWAAPTEGPPIDLSGVPPESLLTVVLRPADIEQDEEGAKVLEALGPLTEKLRSSFEAASGVMLSDVEQLVVTLHERGLEVAQPAYAVRLNEPIDRDELVTRWKHPKEVESGGAEYLRGTSLSYYLGDESDGLVQWFTCGPEEEVKMVAERQGTPPPMRRGMEPLLQASQADRMLTVLFVPHFWQADLLRDGRAFYFGEARKLREPLDWLLGDGVRGGLLSMHLEDELFYAELQVVTDVTYDKYQLAMELRERLGQIPDLVEAYVAERLNPSEYWRRVAFRFPLMIRFVHDHSRVAVEDQRAVINVVLPRMAAHNLAFASEMVLASPTNTAQDPTTAAASTASRVPQTVEAVLEEKIDLKFDQLALESALAAIVDDVRATFPRLPFEFEIKIIGEDFEKGSITRNQQIVNFDMSDASIADVLTAIAMRANPITTVTSPSESDQKLVWVVGPDPDDPSRTIVLLTTRDGAAARKLPLPPVFGN